MRWWTIERNRMGKNNRKTNDEFIIFAKVRLTLSAYDSYATQISDCDYTIPRREKKYVEWKRPTK